MLTHTLPQTEAEKAAIARTRMLTDFEWTPCADIPAYIKDQGYTIIPKGVPVKGVPYGSAEATDTFVCENVSLISFLTAIPNPHSKVYEVGHAAVGRCTYGMVCNGFVRYAFGIPYRVNTHHWYDLPGMREVAKKQAYTVDDLKLCDVLHAFNDGRNHVALITDILRDENGVIVEVEVSEGVAPFCKRESYTVETFYQKYAVFALCRYDLLESIPPLDEEDDILMQSGVEKILAPITVNGGDYSNYTLGEEVVISVSALAADVVELLKNGEKIAEYPTCGPAFFRVEPDRGYYEARLKNTGDAVAFCVKAPNIRHEVKDGAITIYADPCDEKSELWYMDFRMAGERVSGIASFEPLTDAEKQSGVFTRPIPEGAENFKVYFKNPYGVWSHRMVKI